MISSGKRGRLGSRARVRHRQTNAQVEKAKEKRGAEERRERQAGSGPGV